MSKEIDCSVMPPYAVKSAEWQPIETAPKQNDEPVLIWDGYDINIGVWREIGRKWFAWANGEIAFGPWDSNATELTPTHWMHLPPPPIDRT